MFGLKKIKIFASSQTPCRVFSVPIFRFLFAATLLALSLCGNLHSQGYTNPSSPLSSDRILARAKSAFEQGDYAEAMTICAEARNARNNEHAWNIYTMEYVMNIPEVRRRGQVIADLIPILREREEYNALEIIDYYLNKKGEAFFNNSVQRLYRYLDSLKDYPECDFLLSRIYRLEGEFDLAMEYIERARLRSEILDISDERFDILYEMADLARVQGNNDTYEKTLLMIVESDSLYKNETIRRAIYRSVSLEKSGVDEAETFFTMFRADALNSMKAYFSLGNIYAEQGEARAAFTMTAFGVLSGFTHALDILEDRAGALAFDPSQRSLLEFFFAECARYDDVINWTMNTKLWQGFFDLAVRARDNGWDKFAASVLRWLKSSCPDPYWKNAAASAL